MFYSIKHSCSEKIEHKISMWKADKQYFSQDKMTVISKINLLNLSNLVLQFYNMNLRHLQLQTSFPLLNPFTENRYLKMYYILIMIPSPHIVNT